MTITPKITEVHERQYAFNLTPEQVQDAIVSACVRAAGLSFPLGADVEIISDAAFAPAGIRFAVPVEVEKTADQILAGIESLTNAPAAAQEQPSRPELPISAPSLPESRVAPVAPLARPVRASAKPPRKFLRPMAWGNLTTPERSIVMHLESLPDTLSPSDDLRIVQGLTGGLKAPAVAVAMGITPEEVVARWKAMLCGAVLDGGRTPTIAGQERLLAALRYRVETEE